MQPTNDIEGLLDKYGDRICLMGGYDTNGPAGRPEVTPEEIRREVQRDFDVYGKHRGYIFFGFLLVKSGDPAERKEAMKPLVAASIECAEASRKKAQ